MCHMVMEEGWLFVADEGKQVLSNSDAVAACVHALQEAMLLVFPCVHLCSLACAHAFQEAMRDSTAFRASAE